MNRRKTNKRKNKPRRIRRRRPRRFSRRLVFKRPKSRHIKKAKKLAKEAAREIARLRRPVKSFEDVCGEYGVTPKDYERQSDDFEGAWNDYIEGRAISIVGNVASKLGIDQSAANQLVLDNYVD